MPIDVILLGLILRGERESMVLDEDTTQVLQLPFGVSEATRRFAERDPYDRTRPTKLSRKNPF